MAKSIGEKLKTKGLLFFVSFFYVICKISNFDMWTTKHLAQASYTELTLFLVEFFLFITEIEEWFSFMQLHRLLEKDRLTLLGMISKSVIFIYNFKIDDNYLLT